MVKRINKEQVAFAIKAMMMSAEIALRSKSIPTPLAKELKEKCVVLLEKLQTEKLELPLVVKEYNKMVETFNVQMDASTSMRYPPFIAMPEANQVKANIISFEFFLNQKLRAKEMTLQQEEPLFDECLELWKNVGLKVTPREGMMFLSRLIQKANVYSSEEKFPLPDDTQY